MTKSEGVSRACISKILLPPARSDEYPIKLHRQRQEEEDDDNELRPSAFDVAGDKFNGYTY